MTIKEGCATIKTESRERKPEQTARKVNEMNTNSIKIVVGSWGSYNECNDRALGSKWLDLSDYNDWEEIKEELEKEGFELNGMDEELFIQDCEGISGFNGDFMHPEKLFNICKESGILDDEYKYKTAKAYLEAMGWSDFEDLVEDKGESWDDDIYFYEGMTVEEVLEEMVEECYPDIDFDKLGWVGNYITIDYEAMARDADGYYEVSDGTIEIR